ncbi:MAG: winged-helix domain-containing protein [Kosmotogaceae bacterium]
MDSRRIPKPTIKRLAVYHRCLENLVISGVPNVSSKDLAERLGIKASQVRKSMVKEKNNDLSGALSGYFMLNIRRTIMK